MAISRNIYLLSFFAFSSILYNPFQLRLNAIWRKMDYIKPQHKQYLLMPQSYWLIILSTVFWLNQIDVCIASNFWCVDMHWVSIIFDALFARYIYNEHMCISWLIFIFIYGFFLNHVPCWKFQQRIKHVQIGINRIIFYCKWNRNYQTALSSDN